MIAARIRLNTNRVVAMQLDTNALGSMWWPMRTEDAVDEKILTLWQNSSLGLLNLLWIRNTTTGSWVQWKKADLRKLPILDPRALSGDQRQALCDLFDQLADTEFERLPAMAECPARTALDNGLSQILDLPDLGRLRSLLASEPSVSNQRL